MEGLYDGSQKLYVHVDDEKGITDAINFAVENGMEMVVVGGYQAYTVTGLLSNNINVAKILGIDGQLGTLETGKNATFFISEGDALDMRGNQLTHAFIAGRAISLETHQTKLWKRYSNKYKGQ